MKYLVLFGWVLALFFACSDDKENDPIVPPGPDEPETPDTSIPAGLRDGINQLSDDSLAFVLFAPKKSQVYLIGDFNDWSISNAYKMQKDGDRFWLKIGGLQKGKEYICQYLIDGSIRVADPYADKISDPWNDASIPASAYPDLIAYPSGKTTEIAMVVSTGRTEYPWSVANFRIDDVKDMVIYEILLRDFTSAGTIKAAREKIPYLKELGVNAVELMPFNEFEGNDSWGYNPSFYFAPDKAYGTADDYKAFIDECHRNGMAVIMDMVLNHSYGQSPLVRMYQDGVARPSADNPWYNQKSNFANPDAQWGADFNHESQYTKKLVDSICAHWMKYYKVDGFRFDFTKGFSNTPYPASGNDSWGNPYDAARIRNLKRIYDEIKRRNPDALMICEHLSDNDEEKELADYGLLLWGNINYNFNEATMGFHEFENGRRKSDIHWASYKERGWSKPNLIAYMESHDEERIMYKNLTYGNVAGNYNVKQLNTSLERVGAAAVMLMSFPGPKMIWQFGELGYDYQLNDDRLAKKPVRWDYYNVPERKALYDVFTAMNRLRHSYPAFSTSDYTISVGEPVKQILLKSSGGDACVIANFDVVPVNANINFSKTGTWKEYFTNHTFTVTAASMSMELQPGEYRVYLND